MVDSDHPAYGLRAPAATCGPRTGMKRTLVEPALRRTMRFSVVSDYHLRLVIRTSAIRPVTNPKDVGSGVVPVARVNKSALDVS